MDMGFRKQLVNTVWEFINKYDLNKDNGAEVMFTPDGRELNLTLELPSIVTLNMSIPLDDIDEEITIGELYRKIKEQLNAKLSNWDINEEFAKIYDPVWFNKATLIMEWLEEDKEHLIRIIRN